MSNYEVVTSIYPDPEKLGCFTAVFPPILLRSICKLLTEDSSHEGHFSTVEEAEAYLSKHPKHKGSYRAGNGKHYVSDGGRVRKIEYFPDIF